MSIMSVPMAPMSGLSGLGRQNTSLTSFAPARNTNSLPSTTPSSPQYVHPYVNKQHDFNAYKNTLSNPTVGAVQSIPQAPQKSMPMYHPSLVAKQSRMANEQANPGRDKNSVYWESSPLPIHTSSTTASTAVNTAVNTAANTAASKPESFGQSFGRRLKGLVYDLKHLNKLPGKSIPQKVSFACSRDNRKSSIGIVLLIVLAVVFIGVLFAYTTRRQLNISGGASKEVGAAGRWFNMNPSKALGGGKRLPIIEYLK